MRKKEEKAKVGRPKLADQKMKKESIFICLFYIVAITIFAVIGYNILTINSNPKYLVGTIYNDHINKCVIENSSIDCGPNVIYMKYTTDGKNYKELNKTNESLTVQLKENEKVEFCYKTNKEKLKCSK